MDARLIQDEVPLGSQVKFDLQSGKDISGRLVEIGQEHVKIETEKDRAPVLIPIERIDLWQPLIDDPQDAQNSQSGQSLANGLSDRSTAEEKSAIDQFGDSKSPFSSSEIETEKKLIEIETLFQAKCQSAKIELETPDFKFPIENPYAQYAEGGIVGDPAMLFGRDELIQNIASTIRESRLQSKCVMVFGQKRSGKSSVLYHLKKSLQEDKELLILDLGSIGSIQEEDSSVQFLYQILKLILTELEYAVEDRVDDGFSSLALSIRGGCGTGQK